MFSLTIIGLLLSLFALASAQLKAYPQSVEVAEGTWANFTCTIKPTGTIYWRIGSLVHEGCDEHAFYELNEFEGVRAKEDNIKISRTRLSETIEILATMELDGTPVECVFESGESGSKRDYSPFASLNVYPAIGSDTEEGSGANNIRGLRSVLDSEAPSPDMASGESQCAIMASFSVIICSLIATLAKF